MQEDGQRRSFSAGNKHPNHNAHLDVIIMTWFIFFPFTVLHFRSRSIVPTRPKMFLLLQNRTRGYQGLPG